MREYQGYLVALFRLASESSFWFMVGGTLRGDLLIGGGYQRSGLANRTELAVPVLYTLYFGHGWEAKIQQ